MVHLVAPGWNVIGAGEPGLPGVALGHNENIAWGFTIFGLDQQDLYAEELNPADALEYKTETGWKKMDVQRERFLVKGSAPAEVDLKFTRHGPILWQDGKRALALRWVGTEPGTAGYLASLAIDRAENWDQFEAAVARWRVPSENLVYADVAGNIGEHSAGLAPIRVWTGLLPVPGNANYNWTGFVPPSELPHSFNPKEGFVATANNKMIADHYPYNVGFEWAPNYRVTRIRNVIDSAKRDRHRLAVADMEALQSDVTSLPALEFLQLIKSTLLVNDPTVADFLHWDSQLTRKSSDAALFEVWFQKIGLALAQRFSKQHSARYTDVPPENVLRILSHPDRDLFGDDFVKERDRMLAATLQSARKELEKRLGPNASQWTWGQLHTVNFRHALDQQPSARGMFDLGSLSRPGDEYTVNATGTEGDSWEQVSGASYREILDTSNWDQSVAVNTPGQSGQPGSPHYSDLMKVWDAGRYFPLVYSRGAVEKETTDRLVLKP
jgi:penicillin amidase